MLPNQAVILACCSSVDATIKSAVHPIQNLFKNLQIHRKKSKGKKTAHIVTHTDEFGKETPFKVSQREAPGAELRDRKCNHGAQRASDDDPAERRKRLRRGRA